MNDRKVLIDILHPAHVLLFRNLIVKLQENGIPVIVAAREKDVTLNLLDESGIPYLVISSLGKSVFGLAKELLVRDFALYKIVKKEKPQLLIGTSAMICHVSRVTSAQSVVFEEDDSSVKRLIAYLGYPFAHHICTPDCLPENHGKKHIKYNSLHELAYLHPNHFVPDPGVLREIGVAPDEPYFVLRFVSLQASHDIGEKGLHDQVKLDIIERLKKYGRVFISAEGALAPVLEPYRLRIQATRIHHVLAFARLLVGDSQTMTAEAAVLGTPSIRYNSFVGRISYLEELEHRYRLTFGFKPGQESELIEKLEKMLANPALGEEWSRRRAVLLQDKMNLSDWMYEYIRNLLNKSAGTRGT